MVSDKFCQEHTGWLDVDLCLDLCDETINLRHCIIALPHKSGRLLICNFPDFYFCLRPFLVLYFSDFENLQ